MKGSDAHLVIPAVPCLGDDGLERGELLVGHAERAQQMLLEQRRTGEREEQRRGEGLAAERGALRKRRLVRRQRRGQRLRLLRLLLLLGLLLHLGEDLVVLAVGGGAIVDLVHARDDLVAHVEPEVAHPPLLHEQPVLALPLARRRTDPVAAVHLLGRQVLLPAAVCAAAARLLLLPLLRHRRLLHLRGLCRGLLLLLKRCCM